MGWVLTQQGGERKSLTLDGYAAPFGRPRQQAVAKEVIKVTIQSTRYPASSGPPTRHAFGYGWEPMQLNGRWMTRWLPAGQTANGLADSWSEFVKDTQPITLAWGNIVSYSGVIEELELGREGEHDIAWKMTVLIDRRTDVGASVRTQQTTTPTSSTDALKAFVAASGQLAAPALPDMAPDFFEALDNAAGDLKRLTGQLSDLADTFSNIEKQSFSTVQSFLGVIANVQAAIATMRVLVPTADIDAVLTIRRAESEVAWYAFQLDFDNESLDALSTLSDLKRSVELQAPTNNQKFIVAQEGDSWERLATRAGIGVDKAGTLREANGIRAGERPQVGTQYLVP